jgi:hypothetical protein
MTSGQAAIRWDSLCALLFLSVIKTTPATRAPKAIAIVNEEVTRRTSPVVALAEANTRRLFFMV